MSHDAAWADVAAIREKTPLVLNITNDVVTNTTANALLALGASPAMTHAPEDARALGGLASAVVLNTGTPDPWRVESMVAAGQAANAAGAPVVLDPVAVGATPYRQQAVRAVLDAVKVAVVRGNASEILFLAGEAARSRGVDSLEGSGQALEAAGRLARELSAVVCVSGERDVVTDGRSAWFVDNGHPLMPLVTGLGCTASALVGAFAAVNPDRLAATVHAMAVLGLAGELAGASAQGPGSLQVGIYDALYRLDRAALAAGLRVARP